MSKRLTFTLALLLLLLIALAVAKLVEIQWHPKIENVTHTEGFMEKPELIGPIFINDTIRIGKYFDFMDSLVSTYDSVTNYTLSEHLLVNANPWIIDTLVKTDYYSLMERDSFMLDQREMIVLRPTDTLLFPDSLKAQSILESFKKTWIDINLPEYRLRIYEDSSLLQSFPIRIGQNKRKYLKMTDRITDLKTKTGKGHTVGFRKNPAFYNPITGMRFLYTKRDDGNTTLMPQIPWIETKINGVRNGQLIHPTTNPITLEKASSNGCIGVKEAHAWIIYYSCPVGTPIHIRYDLKIRDLDGAITELKDVYQLGT
jgi:L,D-transpeptidase ErfK/SrfK